MKTMPLSSSSIKGMPFHAYNTIAIYRKSRLVASVTMFVLLVCLSACGTTSTTPQAQNVNGFGTAANHGHAMLALPDSSVLLATHFGMYRSADSGKSWSGPDTTMGSMMTSSLTASPFNSHRVYTLAERSLNTQTGTIGLYTSTDEGKSWSLASSANDTGKMYTVVAGNSSIDEVYAYVVTKGAHGFLVSEDAGKHFTSPGALPFGRILGILPLPGAPGQVLVYGNDGAALSKDKGAHWTLVKGFDASSYIYSMVSGGPHYPVYAASDAGIYVSQDNGKSFKQVFSQSRSALTAVPDEPQWIYGKTGRQVFKSTDGGHSWNALPDIKGNLENLAPDPHNVTNLYLSLSYPTAVYHYDAQNATWQSLTPKA